MARKPMDEGQRRRLVSMGRRIASLRALVGWNQQELADSAGIQQTVISRIEAGKTDPLYSTLDKIARTLGVTIQQLEEPLPGMVHEARTDYSPKKAARSTSRAKTKMKKAA